ncbi:sporulation membrane protein YtaF [Bacillota bacterium LX-D]|nr:sporulation membrane protein YtaF [Bacillota bacterium LX-D]
MGIIHAMIFALAVSLDGFGVGISYGIRRIKVPWYSLLIICLTSTLAITISMLFGNMLAQIISTELAEKIGSFIMVAVGIWILIESIENIYREKNSLAGKQEKLKQAEKSIMRIKIPMFGVVIQILREPIQADFDNSGVIGLGEACVLGLALAMDALGAGFGAAVAGYQFFLVPLFVGLFKLILVPTGLYLGKKWGKNSFGEKGALLPGLILIILGLSRI